MRERKNISQESRTRSKAEEAQVWFLWMGPDDHIQNTRSHLLSLDKLPATGT